ncbi:hypothetical protein [Tropicimonas sp. IMCC34043]|uniref:hypothetical protein n=1 Tax=Tropicimonas sp. IMCC34043 TaxID=2248760 RepID=UPI000E26E359|nr:hypothetical protein [Tropicimonas sp. IMCC34043]
MTDQPESHSFGRADFDVKDFTFLCTTCRRSGEECAAALDTARALAMTGAIARSAAPDFGMSGVTFLGGCDAQCAALFVLSRRGVELYCGVAPDADPAVLAAFAASFLSCDPHVVSASRTPPPLAFVLGPIIGNGPTVPPGTPVC